MRQESGQGYIEIQNSELLFLQSECAGVGSRTAAYLLDSLIRAVFFFGIILLLSLMGLWGQSHFISFMTLSLLGLFYISYHFLFESATGGKTPGKYLTGIRVIKFDGSRVTVIDSLIRNVLRIADILPLFYFIGSLVMFMERHNRRIGDLVSETLVIHDRAQKKSIAEFVDTILLESAISKQIKIRGLEELDEKEKEVIKTVYLRTETMKPDERVLICEKVLKRLEGKVIVEGTKDCEVALYELYKRI